MSKTEAVKNEEKLQPAPSVEQVVEEKTDWDVLGQTGLAIARLRCDGYRGAHVSDKSCHTTLIPTAENVLRHMAPEHGGDDKGGHWFKFKLRPTAKMKDNPALTIWKDLKAAGVEIKELFCPHCHATDFEITPRRLMYHLNPHPGAQRFNLEPQTLCMTLAMHVPTEQEFDDLANNEEDVFFS